MGSRLVAPCCGEEEDGDRGGQASILPARTSLPASPLLTCPSLHSPAYVPLPASPSLHSPAYICLRASPYLHLPACIPPAYIPSLHAPAYITQPAALCLHTSLCLRTSSCLPTTPCLCPPAHTLPASPQAVVSQQDTLLELQLQEGPEKPSRRGSQPAPAEPAARTGEKPGTTELALLQRQHGLLQEELGRCRQLCQERAQEAAALETRLRDSKQERARLERELDEARRQLGVLRQEGGTRGRRGADPRRRSLPAGDALYLSFTPPQVVKEDGLTHGASVSGLSPPGLGCREGVAGEKRCAHAWHECIWPQLIQLWGLGRQGRGEDAFMHDMRASGLSPPGFGVQEASSGGR